SRMPVSRLATLATLTFGAVIAAPETMKDAPAPPQNIGCPPRYCAGVSAAPADGLVVRRARTSDVPAIKALVDVYAGKILLEKNLVTLYEAVQEFWVGELDGEIIGCGALHVLWSDLGEVRTVAVHPKVKGKGIGHTIVDRLLDVARELHLQ